MCSIDCEDCSKCTCTPLQLEFYFEEWNGCHVNFAQAKVEKKDLLRTIEDEEALIMKTREQGERPLKRPETIADMERLWKPTVKVEDLETHLDYMKDDLLNKKAAEYSATMELFEHALVKRVKFTYELIKYDTSKKYQLDKKKFCRELRTLADVALNGKKQEVNFYGMFAAALYYQCHKFGMIHSKELPFKVSLNSLPFPSE